MRRLSADLASAPVPETAADFDGLESQLIDLRRNRDFKRARKGSGPTYAKGVPRATGARGARRADARARRLPAARRRRSRGAAARRAARVRRSLSALKAREGRARLSRPAAARARSDSRQHDRCAITFRPASAASSWTSSRTPIRCRRSCSCCWPRRIPARRAGSTSIPCPASCSSSAIRSSRSIGSAAPTCTSTDRCASSSSIAAPRSSSFGRAFAASRTCSAWSTRRSRR